MPKLNILVVDDDVDNANSLGELFEMEGHRANVVYSGEAAIEAYLRAEYDLAFLDVMMPGLNGVESFLHIRRLRPSAKVYMMSGFSVEELLKQAVANGALGLLSKPVPPQRVIQLVNDVGRNGLVVAPNAGPGFAEQLSRELGNGGTGCSVIHSPAAIPHARTDEVMILDLNKTVIDQVGHYSNLRKAQDMPPTVILAPPADASRTGNALQDMSVTGILNKPFDPDNLLAKLPVIAG
jgi:CheY-like chemotaxis protein